MDLEKHSQKTESLTALAESNLQWISNIKPQKYQIDAEKFREFYHHPHFGEPANYWNYTLDNFKCDTVPETDIIMKLRCYDGTGLVVLLNPETGTGKTHLAIATARELLKKKIYEWIDKNKDNDFGYVDFAEKDFRNYIEFYTPLFMTENKCYKIEYGNIVFNFGLYSQRTIIIDDLFASKINEYSRTAIYEIINTRVTNNNLPTIFTSNVLLKDMPDSRISSRLQGDLTFELTSTKDYRGS